MTPVTKAFIPPIEDYITHLQSAFDAGWLTNRGQLVCRLEQILGEYLVSNTPIIMNNGTIPLQLACSILGNGGEIITTPFSYVATTSSIVWQNCTPVFVDIDPDYLTLDENLIENNITDKTTCILATHVFGNPCAVHKIQEIAKKHKLKVIYDAAHCFGVRYENKSIFNFGDVSTCSFHATKIFHTGEGGAVFVNNDVELREKFYYSHNFGHDGPLAFHGLGINGKISELQAAMGLAVFPYLNEILEWRAGVVARYDQLLDFSCLRKMKIRENTAWNYSYYPVVFVSEEILLLVQKKLNDADIHPRRYFYPSLDTLPYINSEVMPISRSISSRILCLPRYFGLEDDQIVNICRIITACLA
jgi:dTDP-4-amino-4,6-dideoxygalactose transaminase